MFFCLVLNKPAEHVIEFEESNRRRTINPRLEPMLYRKTHQAMAKAYFPEIHKNYKTLYPAVKFKPSAPIATEATQEGAGSE